MTNKILSDFFYGNIVPNEKQFDRNSEFGRAADELAKEEEKLRTMLDDNTLALLDRMIQLQGTVTGMTAEGYFIDGFQTGFRIALAVLYEGEKPFLKAVSEGT
ncbi:hypothetical protein HMPREF1032_02274 [Subdoligranulum sp. 4_3_54A2FAA]|uniref:DUF6809 family protein n=1 Tax=Clostridioides difficile TaxID=1496 RepID=UPI000240F8AB|nr:DUF6809 family protein [Clostridioides difficile]EHL74386.1 hypothetical protein HMPREF1032_02274 [Subdoligranulum sp. 4_3_54A2FAA]OCN06057.1 hypothetical protein A4S06_06530 [Erysipelotrichaceae bacterium MTC7]OFA24656.1 hypothetical protein BW28_05950 [Clostridioides difficile]HAU5011467.1 hypothetical protein [Clostridioides difficile]HAU5029459.1 hypothetical protein [Clostridioides difficile]